MTVALHSKSMRQVGYYHDSGYFTLSLIGIWEVDVPNFSCYSLSLEPNLSFLLVTLDELERNNSFYVGLSKVSQLVCYTIASVTLV